MNDDYSTSEVRHEEPCSLAMVQRVAAMLDIAPEQFEQGMALPRGWQFILLAGGTRRSALREDGFPGLGVSLPDLGLPRLLQTGRTVKYHHDILIGSLIERRSRIDSIQHKTSSQGPMAVVTLRHQLGERGAEAVALEETQTYVMLSDQKRAAREETVQPLPDAQHRQVIVPDETLLFQYCALCFNSHKIHLNRAWAREVEGFPDLLVNGGLTTLLMTEFLRRDRHASLASFSAHYLTPLYCDRPLTLTAEESNSGWLVQAWNSSGQLAAKLEGVSA
jgi:3-methylfumaryl-CoA hydratase